MNELLPCPFCGNEAPEFERVGSNRQSCIVICGRCGARHESSDEGARNGSSWNQRAALAAQPGSVPADCDVRKILLKVVPGDGDGYEVYPKSIADVEAELSDMGLRLEEWEMGIRRLPAAPTEAKPAQQDAVDARLVYASPIFTTAIDALNKVKAWRDCDGNDGFPHDVREQIDAVLIAYEARAAISAKKGGAA